MADAFHVKIYLLFISLAIDSGQLFAAPSRSPFLSRAIAILFAWATTVITAMRHAPLYLIDDYLFIVEFYQYIANNMHTNT